jgi:hypothetical protein
VLECPPSDTSFDTGGTGGGTAPRSTCRSLSGMGVSVDKNPADRSAGLALLSGAALLLVLSSLRPAMPSLLQPALAIDELVRTAAASRWIYGAILIGLGLTLFGQLGVAGRLGWTSTRVRLGAVALVAGVAFLSGSALLRGFVMPDLARSYAGSAPDVLSRALSLVQSLAVTSDVLAKLGFGAVSAAVLGWSIALVSRPREQMMLGALGLAVTVVPALLLFAGVLHLAGTGLEVVAGALAAWSIAAGALLARTPEEPAGGAMPSVAGA